MSFQTLSAPERAQIQRSGLRQRVGSHVASTPSATEAALAPAADGAAMSAAPAAQEAPARLQPLLQGGFLSETAAAQSGFGAGTWDRQAVAVFAPSDTSFSHKAAVVDGVDLMVGGTAQVFARHDGVSGFGSASATLGRTATLLEAQGAVDTGVGTVSGAVSSTGTAGATAGVRAAGSAGLTAGGGLALGASAIGSAFAGVRQDGSIALAIRDEGGSWIEASGSLGVALGVGGALKGEIGLQDGQLVLGGKLTSAAGPGLTCGYKLVCNAARFLEAAGITWERFLSALGFGPTEHEHID